MFPPESKMRYVMRKRNQMLGKSRENSAACGKNAFDSVVGGMVRSLLSMMRFDGVAGLGGKLLWETVGTI